MATSDEQPRSAADRVAVLVDLIHTGDDTAVGEIFDAAFQDRQLRGTAGRVDRQYVEEAWDTACWSAVRFIRAQDRPPRFTNFDGWFYRILLREARRLASEDAEWSRRNQPMEPGGDIAASGRGPYEAIIDQFQLRHLTDRIARELRRPAERRAFETHMLTGFRNEELAKALNVDPGAARVALHRALKSAEPILIRLMTTARLAEGGTSGCPGLAALVGGRELPLPDAVWDDVRRHTDRCRQCQRMVARWGAPSPVEQTRILQKVADGRLYLGSPASAAPPTPTSPAAAVHSSPPFRLLPRAAGQVVRKKAATVAVASAAAASVAALMVLPGEPGAQATPRLPVADVPDRQPGITVSPSLRPTPSSSRPTSPAPTDIPRPTNYGPEATATEQVPDRSTATPSRTAGRPVPSASQSQSPPTPTVTPIRPTNPQPANTQPNNPSPGMAAINAGKLFYDTFLLWDAAGTPSGALPTSGVRELSPGRYGIQVASGQPPIVWFTVRAGGVIDYEPRHEAVLDGRGERTLMVTGVPVTIDTRQLAQQKIVLANHNAPMIAGVPTVQLLPGEHGVIFGSAEVIAGSFEVTEQGRIKYPAAVDIAAGGYLNGNSTTRLTLVGHRIQIDARGSGATGVTLADLNLTAGPDVRVVDGNLLPSEYRLTLDSGVVTCPAATVTMTTTGTVTLSPMLARHAEVQLTGRTPTVRLTSKPPAAGAPGC